MTNNRKIANSIFNELKRNKLIPKDITFTNGYFIFYMGEDSVVHFNIKGIKKWKFGMWIDIKNENPIQFFAQYTDFIDKFKPSASIFSVNINNKSLANIVTNKDNTKWVYYKIVNMCKHIKYNPMIAFVQEATDSNYITSPLWKLYAEEKLENISDKFYKIKKHIINDIIEYRVNCISAFILKTKYPNIIEDITICDNSIGGFRVSPRYDVEILFKRVHSDDLEQGFIISDFMDKHNVLKLFMQSNSTVRLFVDKISRDTEWD